MWEGHHRALPPDWNTRRAATRTRAGGACETPGCPNTGTDCDHINDPDNHDLTNLQWLCRVCHTVKTQAQAKAAADAQRAKLRHPMNRRTRFTA